MLNKENGMVLIEGATDMPAKWNRHRTDLRFGSHHNKRLQKDWNKSGETNFLFSEVSDMKIDKEQNLDLDKELKLLTEMVLEEKNIQKEYEILKII